jgi:5-enolpyruvylshikimate-3-phosphate synthase
MISITSGTMLSAEIKAPASSSISFRVLLVSAIILQYLKSTPS